MRFSFCEVNPFPPLLLNSRGGLIPAIDWTDGKACPFDTSCRVSPSCRPSVGKGSADLAYIEVDHREEWWKAQHCKLIQLDQSDRVLSRGWCLFGMMRGSICSAEDRPVRRDRDPSVEERRG